MVGRLLYFALNDERARVGHLGVRHVLPGPRHAAVSANNDISGDRGAVGKVQLPAVRRRLQAGKLVVPLDGASCQTVQQQRAHQARFELVGLGG